MTLRFVYLKPVIFYRMTTAERDAEPNWPDYATICNTDTGRIQRWVFEQWIDVAEFYGTPSDEDVLVWNDTEGLYEPKSPAEYLAMLSGEAAAGFDWGGQNLTNIGNVGIADDDLVEIDDSNVTVGEFAQFTADGLKGEPAGTGDYNLVRIDHEEGVEEGDFPRFTEDGVEPRTPVELLQDLSGIADDPFNWNDQELRNVRSVDTDTINESTGGAGVTIDGVKLKDDTALIDANSATALLVEQDGVNNDVLLVDTATPRVTINAELDVNHTAAENDDHAVEIDVDAAGYGDIKAIDVIYDTGDIAPGEDEAIILIDINEFDAGGGEVFGLEVLSTSGGADAIYAVKAGAVVGPILQEAGTFANPNTATNDTATTNVAEMKDGSTGTNTTIFVADDDYIIIGATNPFTEIEFNIETAAANPGIKPTFEYSKAGGAWSDPADFSPVDGTNGFRNSGVIAWDAADLTGHAVHTSGGDPGDTYDIRITRTHAVAGSVSLFYANTAATTAYSWDEDGKLTIADLNVASNIVVGGTVDGVDIAARDHAEAHEPESHNSTDITGAELETLSDTSDADALHDHGAHGVTHNAAHGISKHTEHANWKVLYTDGSGDEQELALGADGEVLTSTGAAGAPAFEAGGGGGAATKTINFVIDGGGAEITDGEKGHIVVETACTINQVTLLADQDGAIVVDIWKDTYANFPPTNADSITAAAVPTITATGGTDVKYQDSTLTGWTTAIAAGDVLAFNVDSCTSQTRVTVALKVTPT